MKVSVGKFKASLRNWWRPDVHNERRSLTLCGLAALVGLVIAGIGLFNARGTRIAGVPPEDAAVVNRSPILLSDYVAQLQALYNVSPSQATSEQKRATLDSMIREELYVQRGIELGLQNDFIEIRNSLVSAVEAQQEIDANATVPTEQELRDFYQSHLQNFLPEGQMTVTDYVAPDLSSAQRAVAALRSGTDPASAMVSNGLRSSGATDDGEEFYFAVEQHLGSALFAIAKSLHDGQFSDPSPTADACMFWSCTPIASPLLRTTMGLGIKCSRLIAMIKLLECAREPIVSCANAPMYRSPSLSNESLTRIRCPDQPADARRGRVRTGSHPQRIPLQLADRQRLVRTTITFPDKEAETIAGGRRPSDAEIVTYLTSRIGVSAAGQTCRLTAPGHVLEAATGYRRSEYIFDCTTDKNLVLQFNAFFELTPSHVDFAQIQFADGDVVEQLFTQSDRRFDLTESQDGRFKSTGFIDFVQMGSCTSSPAWTICPFCWLVLISRRLRDLVFVVSGFTLGHSITLALAVTGIIRPHAQYIDALVALTIALVGVENIVLSLEKPTKLALATGGFLLVMAVLSVKGIGVLPPALLLGAAIFSAAYLLISGQLHDSGRLRMVVTTIFGLIHGFGFAADLLEAKLPPESSRRFCLASISAWRLASSPSCLLCPA